MTTRKQYSREFKLDAIGLVLEQGYSRAEAARSLEINANMLGRWIKEHQGDDGQSFRGNGRLTAEQTEIRRLREENRRLKMEKDILKKATVGLPPTSLPRKRGEVRVHHPAQEDLAGRRNVSTTGCESP
jgi:transposase